MKSSWTGINLDDFDIFYNESTFCLWLFYNKVFQKLYFLIEIYITEKGQTMFHVIFFACVKWQKSHIYRLKEKMSFWWFLGPPFIGSSFIFSLQTFSNILCVSLARFSYNNCIVTSESQCYCFRTTCNSWSLWLVSQLETSLQSRSMSV